MPEQTAALDCWAIVEILGHKQFAGHVSEHVLGAAALIRVDVPATEQPDHATKQYSKLIGVGVIYCITPCTEAIARAAATRLERYNNPIPVDLPVPRLTATVGADSLQHDDFSFLDDDAHDDDPEGL